MSRFIHYSLIGLCFTFFATAIYFSLNPKDYHSQGLHEHFHHALFLGKRIPKAQLSQSFQSLGLLHLLVISGLHFYWISKSFKKILNQKYHIVIPLLLLLLWEKNIPVLRSFFFCFLKEIDEIYGRRLSENFVFLISLLLCLFFVKTPQEYHSLWLSSVFFTLVIFLYQHKKFSQSLGQFILFFLSPFILPFASELSPLSFLANILICPLLMAFFYLSPALHLLPEGSTMCELSHQQLISFLEDFSRIFPVSHPKNQAGGNLLWGLILGSFLYWRFEVYRCKQSLK